MSCQVILYIGNIKKFIFAVLHWKQGMSCDKTFYFLTWVLNCIVFQNELHCYKSVWWNKSGIKTKNLNQIPVISPWPHKLV